MRHVHAMQRRPVDVTTAYLSSPLVVLNNFADSAKHLKVCARALLAAPGARASAVRARGLRGAAAVRARRLPGGAPRGTGASPPRAGAGWLILKLIHGGQIAIRNWQNTSAAVTGVVLPFKILLFKFV